MATHVRPGALRVSFAGLAALLVGIGIGRFGYPPLIPSIIDAGWFPVAQADYLGAMNLAGYVAGSALASRAGAGFPASILIRASLWLVALSFVGCAFPLPFLLYSLLRIAAGFAGGFIMVLTAPTILASVSESRRGLAGGIIFSGVGVGIALSGTLIPVLVRSGLTITWLAYAGLAALLTLTLGSGIPTTPPVPREANGRVRAPRGASPLNRTVILLMASYACNAVGFVPHTVFWVDFIARGLGKGIALGNMMWIVLGISAAVGPLLTGLLADRAGFARSIRASLLVKGVGVLLPVFFTSLWALLLSSICTGALALGISSLAAGRVAELTAPEDQKRVWGWMTIAFSVGHAATAYALSWLFSVTGSYHLLFIIGAATLVIGSLLDYWSSRSAAGIPVGTPPRRMVTG